MNFAIFHEIETVQNRKEKMRESNLKLFNLRDFLLDIGF